MKNTINKQKFLDVLKLGLRRIEERKDYYYLDKPSDYEFGTDCGKKDLLKTLIKMIETNDYSDRIY